MFRMLSREAGSRMNNHKSLHINLALMAKAPRAGYVKTRLHKAFSPEQACDIYRCFLGRAGALAESWQQIRPNIHLILAFDPPDKPHLWDAWNAWNRQAQSPGDLGDRLQSVVAYAESEEPSAVIFIGADAPELSVEHLDFAREKLLNHDAVMVPAFDGGYVLLGLHSRAKVLLNGINWGTDEVCGQTREIARQAGLKLAETPPISDVDTADDVAELIDRLLSLPDENNNALATALLKITHR